MTSTKEKQAIPDFLPVFPLETAWSRVFLQQFPEALAFVD
jgi:hypothetical protein